jgi:putative N6-adenine-specific DNA methylase
VRLVEATIKKLKMNDSISVRRIPFEKNFPKTPTGMIVCNPPYGERIGENVNELYKLIGDTLKNHYTGFDAWMISSNMEAFKHVKLRASKKIVLFNGPLECKFQKYEMYQGTREPSTEEVKS